MAKLSRLLLGYRKISCRDGEVVKAVSVILKNGISAEFVSGNEFLISERDYSRIKHDLDERVACDASEILGVFGKIKAIEHKVAIAVAMVVSILLIFLASDTVWDIRVENAGGSLENERQKMQRVYERMLAEIKTYENNIGFLTSSSKKGNTLVDAMNKKVEKLREELNLLVQKIKAVDEQMRGEKK